MTKPGGTIVYSTCSLNPLENEAVVTEVLRSGNEFTKSSGSGPCLELLDIHSEPHALKGLIGRKGVKNWDVLVEKEDGPCGKNEENKQYEVEDLFTIYKEYTDELETVKRGKIQRSMFPLPKEEMDKFNIERCFRVMPHDQDTGGFFVTVIKKNSFVYFVKNDNTQEKTDETDLAYEAIKENAQKLAETNADQTEEITENTPPADQAEGENVEKHPRPDAVIKIIKANHEYFKLAEELPEQWENIKKYYEFKDDRIKDLLYIQQKGTK
jgi:multisite-specific tRNA:(cytosine-C5)-methyltransferase